MERRKGCELEKDQEDERRTKGGGTGQREEADARARRRDLICVSSGFSGGRLWVDEDRGEGKQDDASAKQAR